MIMERYVLFCSLTYYASGGWLDMQGSYKDLESA
jgi:hypothetical protein